MKNMAKKQNLAGHFTISLTQTKRKNKPLKKDLELKE